MREHNKQRELALIVCALRAALAARKPSNSLPSLIHRDDRPARPRAKRGPSLTTASLGAPPAQRSQP